MAQTEQIKELTANLEQGVMELFESGKYEEYLRTMSRFHHYSTRNVMLIHQQAPNATLVASFLSWQNNFNRHVKKGEHGIKIFAPIANRAKDKDVEMEVIDPVTKQAVLDENGQPVTERMTPTSALQMRFKLVTIFDYKQTEGEPLPEIAETLTGDVERYELFMDALRAVSPLPIVFEPISDKDGYCKYGDKIGIREGMSQVQTVSTVIHEIAHAKVHDRTLLAENEQPADKRTAEVQAESISFVVSGYFAINTGANSIGYVAEWSKSRELKELKASLDLIHKTADELIGSIDAKYRELAKERGIDLSVVTDEIGAEQNYNMIDGVINNTPPIAAETPITEEMSEIVEAVQAAKSSVATDEPTQSETENHAASDVLAAYARNAEARDPRQIGETVLMTLLFEDGNLNRSGKRSRVKVEPSIGKYEMFSRDEGTPPRQTNYLYAMTASGKLADLGETERLKDLTEARLDNHILMLADTFEKQLAAPTEWADFTAAAFLDRVDEAEAHNVPVRELREAERQAEREAQREQDKQFAAEKRGIFDSRVDEIAKAIENGGNISVAYDAREYDGKNPVLELFRFYGVELPLRTQGWINTTLAAITAQGYSRYTKVGGKKRGESERFGECLDALKKAVKLTPIEQKREQFSQQTPQRREKTKMSIEQENYAKLAEMFPDFANKKYSYMKLESPGFEPLSLEWIFGDRISVMQTYVQEGDLMYDPMIEFEVNDTAKTLNAVVYQNSGMGLYQYHDEDGIGRSVDGNGNSHEVHDLSGKLNDFSKRWFNNLGEQGHKPVRATLWNDGGIDEVDVEVRFDDKGKAVLSEPEEQRKPVGYLSFKDSGEVMTYYSADEMLAAYKREMGSLGADGVRYRGVVDEDLEKKLYAAYAGEYGEDITAPEVTNKIRIDQDNRTVYWDYYNPDSNAGGQYVCNYFDFVVIKEAAKVSKDPDVFFDTVGSLCKQYCVDIDNPDFPDVDKNFRTAPYTFSNCDKESMDFLIASAALAERLDKSAPLLPDPLTTAADRDAYGYTDGGMLSMSCGRAVELFDSSYPIYLLYPDNTEAMALDRDEIRLFDGICGIEREDWENSPAYKRAQEQVAANTEGRREADLLHNEPGMLGIYQIKDGIDEARDFRFAPMKELEAHGITPDRANYELVYIASLPIRDTQTNLHRIFGVFQHDSPECPQDFAGRSVSVSDVIVLQWGGEVSSHFVDSVGFKELPSFTGDEHIDNSFSRVGKSTETEKPKEGLRLIDNEPRKAQQPANKSKPSILTDLDEARKIAESGGKQNNNKKTERGYE
ncbi:hypothetical protein FACS1894219_02270 [Clostridia bacterium]|nr:hypothetical protein FACS1894219_02270 [Clostridia bacterium]